MPVVDLAVDEPIPRRWWRAVGARRERRAGLLEQPEATAETFVEHWLHTGDLARIDDEGLLYIVDRKKDMINRGGENVYSIEVETRSPGTGVGEAAAVAVADEMMARRWAR